MLPTLLISEVLDTTIFELRHESSSVSLFEIFNGLLIWVESILLSSFSNST